MGFRALKIKAEERTKIVKRIVLCVVALLVLVLVIFSVIVPPASWKYHFSKPKVGKRNAGDLRIHFLDVGQGDCTLIELPDGKVMLIDGGDGKSGTKKQVLRYLNALDIDVIDYLVVTHTDKDHCGALDEVFRYKKVVNAYLPHTYDTEDVEYAETYAAAIEEECTIYPFSRKLNLSRLTDTETPYTLRFLYPYSPPAEGGYSKESCVLWLDYMGHSALFCGDAPSAVEEVLLRDDRLGTYALQGVTLSETEILKVAHHGSANSTSQEFLDYLGVETAIISCGEDNSYGHPSMEVCERLAAAEIDVYRTDLDGHVILTIGQEEGYAVRTLG